MADLSLKGRVIFGAHAHAHADAEWDEADVWSLGELDIAQAGPTHRSVETDDGSNVAVGYVVGAWRP